MREAKLCYALEQKIINGLPRSFYVVTVSSFLFQLTKFVTNPIFTLYILDLGATTLQVGLILSIQSFLMIFLQIPLTLVALKIGENRMISIAFIVQATTSILYALAPSTIWLYFIPFYQIISIGSFNQLVMSMASNMAPPKRQGDALGRYMTIVYTGMFIGPIICSVLVAYISYQQLFFVTALFPAIGIVLFMRYATKIVNPYVALKPRRQILRSSTLSLLKIVLRERNVLILAVIRTIYFMSNTIFITLFPIYSVQHLQFSPSLVALLFSVVGFSSTFIKFPAGRISDKVGGEKVLLITFGIIIIVYISIAYARNFILIIILLILFGACWGTRGLIEMSLLANIVSLETKTIAISYLTSIGYIGFTIGSILAGLFANAFHFSTIFLLTALINIPAIPLIYLMKKHKKNY